MFELIGIYYNIKLVHFTSKSGIKEIKKHFPVKWKKTTDNSLNYVRDSYFIWNINWVIK